MPFVLPDCAAVDAPASLAERARTSVGETDRCQRTPGSAHHMKLDELVKTDRNVNFFELFATVS